VDAIKAGDIELALRAMWEGVKAIWADAIYALKIAWINFRERVITISADLWDKFGDMAFGMIGAVIKNLSKITDAFEALREFWTENVGPSGNIGRTADGSLVIRKPDVIPTIQELAAMNADQDRKNALAQRDAAKSGLAGIQTEALAKRLAQEWGAKWDEQARALFDQTPADIARGWAKALDEQALGLFSGGGEGARAVQNLGDFKLADWEEIPRAIQDTVDTLGFFRAPSLDLVGAGESVGKKQLSLMEKLIAETKETIDYLDNIDRNTKNISGVWG
jgi:hypothetical protein